MQVDAEVTAALNMVEEPRRSEAFELLTLFHQTTGFPAKLWPGNIVGFGRYAYRYDSGRSGESLATGFSPRKAELSIYIMPGYADFGPILARLGKHRKGKSCLYLRRLSDADPKVLAELIRAGLADLGTRWPIMPD